MQNTISQNFLDELLVRTDIVELVETRVTLRKMGSNYAALCPFHNEKTPSFTVSPTKQFYYCFGCGAHGNAISFLIQFDRLEFKEAVETLANKAGIALPTQITTTTSSSSNNFYNLLEKVNKFYQAELRRHPKAIDYLKARGITGKIAKHFGIGYAPEGWENLQNHFGHDAHLTSELIAAGMLIKKENSSYDRFRARIMFPIRDVRGRVIAFGGRTLGDDLPKYLNSPETTVFHKGSELYGLYEARQANQKLSQLIIVEGYMDVIALAQFDITYAVATLGTATNAKHLQRLFRYCTHLTFCFDGDNAGKNAAWRALEITLPLMQDGLQVLFMFLPESEDPDSYVRKHGKTEFENAMTKALSLSEFFFQHLTENLNLNLVDDKAKLAAQAKPLLQKIPRGVFQELMLKTLAEKIGMTAEKLAAPMNLKNKEEAPQKINPPRENTIRSPLKIAISLLLKQPELAAEIQDTHFLDNFKNNAHAEILLKLLEILKQRPQLNTGALLEHWDDTKTVEYLAKLALHEHPVPPSGYRDEFIGALARIEEKNQELTMQSLLNKAKEQALTSAEKQQLQQLLAKKSKITQ